jgi:hypothetical protein
VLGFATIDISTGDDTLTVWLTSAEGAHAGHTNAVIFKLGDDSAPRRALDMIRDRYVVLTDRTPRKHSLLIDWAVKPADLSMLAKETSAAQATIRAAFEEHRAERGKAGLIEPALPPVPAPFDQAALEAGTPQQLTLAVADQVMRTWAAWLTTEGERVKRWAYIPGGRKGDTRALLPAAFTKRNHVQPIKQLPS